MKADPRPVVYLVDTNILYSWKQTLISDPKNTPASHLRIKRFCEENQNPIVVPDIVWVEFLSGMLHRDIDVHDDYETALRLFRDQQTLVRQIEQRMRSAGNWELDWEPDTSPFADAQEILQDPNLLDKATFRWMKTNAEKRQKSYQADRDRLKNKILDGMDSAILICLNELASQERYRDHLAVLYTADYSFWRAFRRVKKLHRKWFAGNTEAVFALFPKIFCQHRAKKGGICKHPNECSVLLRREMVCAGLPGKKAHFFRF
ncbi:MAG: hypothetical protein ACLFRG_22745 [Desulfococcaceae bacterium]